MYTLLAKPTIEKDLRSIRAEDLAAVNDKIKSLAEQPRQHKTENSRVSKGTVCASGNIEFSTTLTTVPKR